MNKEAAKLVSFLDGTIKGTQSRESKAQKEHPQESQSICFAPIGGCLIKCEEEIGDGQWRQDNNNQRLFMSDYYSEAREQVKNLPEIESIAAKDAETINTFLQQRGFDIKIQPFHSPPEIGVASVLKILLEWIQPGVVTTIHHGLTDDRYPGVRIKSIHSFYTSKHAQNTIVSIKARNGDSVSMTVFDQPPVLFDLTALVDKIIETAKPIFGYDNVEFPMIDYDEFIDISWMQGMTLIGNNGPWTISQAVQQTKFRMNEIGAKVESAVAMGVRYTHCVTQQRQDLIIDRPFLLWVNRPGMTHPLFIAHFAEDSWKKPKEL